MRSKYIFGILITLLLLFVIVGDFSGWKKMFSYSTAYRISRVLIWIVLLLIFLYTKFIERGDFLFIEEVGKKLWFYPLAIIALYGIVVLGYIPLALLDKFIGFKEESLANRKLLDLFCNDKGLLAFTCITAGVTEELLFRGYILSRLKVLTHSNRVAVAGSAILFATSVITL